MFLQSENAQTFFSPSKSQVCASGLHAAGRIKHECSTENSGVLAGSNHYVVCTYIYIYMYIYIYTYILYICYEYIVAPPPLAWTCA